MRSDKSILLVEDDEIDVMTISRALKDLMVTNPLEVAGNGEEALEHLRNPKNRIPCLILLDLNMPRMSGLEFLDIVKNDQTLRHIPTVVLTSSREEQDKIAAFRNGIAGYMVKPVDYKQFVDVVRTIDLYWTISEFPTEASSDE